MNITQHSFQLHAVEHRDRTTFRTQKARLVLVFGAVAFFTARDFMARIREMFPEAVFAGCSTAGEITPTGVQEETCVITAIDFAHTEVRVVAADLERMEDSHRAGLCLGTDLAGADLSGVLIFGTGVRINGSALIEGLTRSIGNDIPVSGGLAGDGGGFERTWVLADKEVSDRKVVAVGLYGRRIGLGHGSFGGWKPFGPCREITRASGNILHEIDGASALSLYRRYLGAHARDLPESGLLFPLEILNENQHSVGLVRTILGIDESSGSLILAGAVAENGYLRLMSASNDDLIAGAREAARSSMRSLDPKTMPGPGLALLVSCVGRKLVMGDRIDDEISAVIDQIGPRFACTGFYSYGEICPKEGMVTCQLHNQTMTVTLLIED
ncbi:MAG: FIST C-terminal domain-containing protein [Magnetococcales bacterium]|nr:FIST C-terminal domain-containing protein [Magnetococcales bacterium]